ncbi:AbiV family abortive infection protein [Nocardia sp. NPDC005978]|uniref:AbiV family abortive infection protein n=1 Tax=Nocardia sp. NPDC005978 TaxID=3156725 RepID=UPI0033BAD8A5
MNLKLSLAQSRQFWRALMANAVFLVDDARVLLEHGSAGRAHSLIVLAGEELARANELYETAHAVWTAGEGEIVLAKDHLALSKWHKPKIGGTERYGRRLEGFWGDYDTRREPRDSATLDRMKQDGFYVKNELGPSGEFGSPLDFEVEPVADELRRMAGVVEMALISDHSRMKMLAPERYDSTGILQSRLLPIAHPELFDDHFGQGGADA